MCVRLTQSTSPVQLKPTNTELIDPAKRCSPNCETPAACMNSFLDSTGLRTYRSLRLLHTCLWLAKQYFLLCRLARPSPCSHCWLIVDCSLPRAVLPVLQQAGLRTCCAPEQQMQARAAAPVPAPEHACASQALPQPQTVCAAASGLIGCCCVTLLHGGARARSLQSPQLPSLLD